MQVLVYRDNLHDIADWTAAIVPPLSPARECVSFERTLECWSSGQLPSGFVCATTFDMHCILITLSRATGFLPRSGHFVRKAEPSSTHTAAVEWIPANEGRPSDAALDTALDGQSEIGAFV